MDKDAVGEEGRVLGVVSWWERMSKVKGKKKVWGVDTRKKRKEKKEENPSKDKWSIFYKEYENLNHSKIIW